MASCMHIHGTSAKTDLSPSFLGGALLLLGLWLAAIAALGLLDFAGAVGTGILARGSFPALVEGATTQAMGDLPLILVPAFAVPLWICLHIAAFVQIAEARKARQ